VASSSSLPRCISLSHPAFPPINPASSLYLCPCSTFPFSSRCSPIPNTATVVLHLSSRIAAFSEPAACSLSLNLCSGWSEEEEEEEEQEEEENDDFDYEDEKDDAATETAATSHSREQEEKVDEPESVVDLSRLLLQLSVQPSQQQEQSPLPSSPSAASAVPVTRRRSNRFPSPPSHSGSALLAPTPLESVVVSALQSLQQQYAQQTEEAINDRLDGLEAALSEAVAVSLPAPSPSSLSLQSVIEASLSEQFASYAASRSFISQLSEQWEQYHDEQQAGFQRRLKELLEEEERRKKEEERRRRAEEQEAIAREERRRKDEEERQRREQTAAQEAAQQREQEEQKRKEEEQQKQKQEQEAKQRAQQQQQQQQLRQQQPALSQPDAASASSLSSPPPPSAAQQELQPYVEKLREIRSLSSAYSGPNRVKLKILINRTITQISQTLQSVNSKAIALVSTLRQAQQAGREEYAYVLETMAAKLVSQGETRVRLQLQSAFSFAAVVLHLSVADALFFPVLMAALCERCIYAVPLYLDRRHFPSLATYMLAMGYEKSAEGLWEEEDAYFERQQGYVALLAAVLQHHSSAPQLHNLSHAWRWLARVLNQEPRTATAAVLYAFLSTAAFALQRVYGAAQVRKLLQYVRTEMVTRMERGAAVKTAARKASVARLVLWLDKSLDELRRTGGLLEPEGRTMPQTQEQDTSQLQVNAGDDRGT
jgi:hypothetical protein